MKQGHGLMLKEFTGLIIFPNTLKQWNRLLRILLQCQLGDDTLQSWGNIFQNAIHTRNQCLVYGAISRTARIRWSRNQELEMGVAPLTVTLTDPPVIVLLPSLCNFGFY